MRARTLPLFLTTLLATTAAPAGVPFPTDPDWSSSDVSSVSTGAALVDLNRDGWLDLVVANGNDIARQPLVVYHNRGDGTFPTAPTWATSANEYHGHLSVGDVNQDGWPDVAVSVFLGAGGFGDPGHAALYLNDGNGNLPPTPSWISADTYYSFGLALGDADSDGDLDLAVAVGEPYFDPPGANRLYYNLGGALSTTPGWISLENEHNLGVAFGDADNDGDLDVAFAGTDAPHRVYYQTSLGIASSSSWQSLGNGPITVRLAFGDLDRDGDSELVVAENNQIHSGDGRLRVYAGRSTGLSPIPYWSSDYSGYGSEATLGDANGDGWLDLLGGSWGQSGYYASPIRIFPNRYDAPLDVDPGWVSSTGSVIERIVLGDVNNDGLHEATAEFVGDGLRQLFWLPRVPFREVTRVVADGVELAPADYCSDPASGWVSLGAAPAFEIVIDYTYSTRLDMAVANWDGDLGNFLFYSTAPPVLYADVGQTGTELRLFWSGGTAPFDVLESTNPSFGPGLEVKAKGLMVPEWEDEPGTLDDGTLSFYLVY